MRLESLKCDIEVLGAQIHAGRIATTTNESGSRCWLRPGGAFSIVRESLRGNLDREQAALWARAEVEGEGTIFQMAKQMSKDCLESNELEM